MNDDLGRLSVRELIIRLADTEDTIRRAAICADRDDSERQPINGSLIELARTEQRIIRELRQREHTFDRHAWRREQPLAG